MDDGGTNRAVGLKIHQYRLVHAVAIDLESSDVLAVLMPGPSSPSAVMRVLTEGPTAVMALPEADFTCVIRDRYTRAGSGDWVAGQYNRLLRIDDVGRMTTIAAGPPLVSISAMIQDIHAGPGAGDFIVTSAWPHHGFEPSQSRSGLFRIHATGVITRIHAGPPFERPAGLAQDVETGDFVVADALVPALFRVSSAGDVHTMAFGPPLTWPIAVIQDARSHDFIVLEYAKSTIPALYRVSRGGSVTPIHGGPPLQKPWSLAQDPTTGDIIVADTEVLWRVKLASDR